MKQTLKTKIEQLGLSPAPGALDKLELFYRLLLEANKTFNLTHITAEDEAVDKHFVDSLAAAPYLTGGAAVDVGSGAGFPGIPLAVFCPGVRFTLLDSLQKRVGFLQDAITRLQLPNAVATHMRAEDAGKGLLRESQNFALARAVAPLNTLCEYCLPLIQVGGAFLAYKTFSPEETENAQNALKLLGGKLREVKTYTLPGTDISRALVVVDKTAPTPPKYPRGKNKERTEPL